MSSVLQKMKRKRNDAREFQITTSVAVLTLECHKDVWHPNKLVIFWDNNANTKCTKPVPWQPGVNNLFRGTHVWPERDPVTTTSTLYKDNSREGTYEDHPWNIVIKNETTSGKRKIIATASIDLADYISETEKTFEITVTLKPANKNILCGSIEFTLTSVLLEDGIPHRPKEELIREILGDAFKSSSVGSKETTKLKAGKTGIPIEDLNKTVQVQLSSVGDQTDATQGQSDAKESSDQAGKISKPHADTNNNGSRGAKKVRRKAPPPPRPRPPTRRKTSTPVAPAVGKQNDVKEVKSSLSQEKCEERASKKGAKPLTSSRKGKKSKSKNSYPKELNPFDTSSEETRSLSPVMSSSPREMSVQTCDKGTMGKGDGEEKASYTGVPSPKERRKKRHGTKKTKKYPKELNPFGGSSDEEAKTPSSKEAEMKEGVASNVCGEEADEPSSKEAEMKEGVASNDCGEEADEPSSKEAEMKEGVASSVCSDEADKPSSKEAEMKEGVASSVCRGKLGEQKSSEKSSFSDETVLTKKVRRKAPPPPKPRPPTRRKTPAPVAELREKQKDVKEVKSSSVQGNSEEKASKTDDKPLSSCRKGRKTKSKNSYPKELNPLDTSSEETRSLSPDMTSSPQEMSVQTCERGTTEKGDGEEKASYTGVPSPKERRKKCHGIKKAKKYPKELNPLGGSSDEEADTRSSKEAEMKEGVASIVCSEKLGEQKSSEKGSFSDETVVLKKAKPFKPEITELSGGKAEDVVCCAAVDSGTTFGTTYSGTTDAKKRNQRSWSSEAVYSLRKNTPVYEELPVIGDADHSGATASGGIGRGQREATTTGTHEKIHETTVAGELRKAVKAEETDSAAKEKEKQRLACFFNKLLRPVPQKVLQHCTDLSAYVAEEMHLLKEEIDAVDKVSIKLEVEMRQAMGTKDCKEEVDGLTQDWLIMNDYRAELISRKRNLQILDKQEDVNQCCDILRSELKLLFKLEDWRKTAQHRAKEARVLDFLLSFANKSRETC